MHRAPCPLAATRVSLYLLHGRRAVEIGAHSLALFWTSAARGHGRHNISTRGSWEGNCDLILKAKGDELKKREKDVPNELLCISIVSQQGKIFQHGQTPRKITHEAFTFCINEANHSLISGSVSGLWNARTLHYLYLLATFRHLAWYGLAIWDKKHQTCVTLDGIQ